MSTRPLTGNREGSAEKHLVRRHDAHCGAYIYAHSRDSLRKGRHGNLNAERRPPMNCLAARCAKHTNRKTRTASVSLKVARLCVAQPAGLFSLAVPALPALVQQFQVISIYGIGRCGTHGWTSKVWPAAAGGHYWRALRHCLFRCNPNSTWRRINMASGQSTAALNIWLRRWIYDSVPCSWGVPIVRTLSFHSTLGGPCLRCHKWHIVTR